MRGFIAGFWQLKLHLAISLVTAGALTGWVAPQASYRLHLARGGRLYQAAWQAINEQHALACERAPVTDAALRAQLDAAHQELEKGLAYDPQDAHAHLLLGRIRCLLGEPQKALPALEFYTQQRPDNPMGHLELGFARIAACAQEATAAAQETRLCNDAQIIQQAQANWQVFHVQSRDFYPQARYTFEKRDYSSTLINYQRAVTFRAPGLGKLPFPDRYRWALAAILSRSAIPQFILDALPYVKLSDSKTIPAAQFRWLRTNPQAQIDISTPAATKKIDEAKYGVLYHSGRVGVFIQARQSGWYLLKFKALNTAPPPVLARVELDTRPLIEAKLTRGDQSRQTFTARAYLTQGMHLLSVNYLNDQMVNGVDRNLFFLSVRLERGSKNHVLDE